MPFYKQINSSANTIAYFWKITEDLEYLFSQVQLNDTSIARLERMQSVSHKKGFLAVRMLLQHIGLNDFNLLYDAFGKPHLKVENNTKLNDDNGDLKTQLQISNEIHISISHSHEFSCICISNEPIGIDLEKCKEKTIRIAPRFMDVTHLDRLSETDKIKKATIIWGVKESIFKIKNEVGISFPDHITETPFQLEDKKGKATLNFNNKTDFFNFTYDFVEDYIFVCIQNQ